MRVQIHARGSKHVSVYVDQPEVNLSILLKTCWHRPSPFSVLEIELRVSRDRGRRPTLSHGPSFRFVFKDRSFCSWELVTRLSRVSGIHLSPAPRGWANMYVA